MRWGDTACVSVIRLEGEILGGFMHTEQGGRDMGSIISGQVD